jgi:hypothetical protein
MCMSPFTLFTSFHLFLFISVYLLCFFRISTISKPRGNPSSFPYLAVRLIDHWRYRFQDRI